MSKRLPAGDTYVLDFEPRCRCGNHAVVTLEIHKVNDCESEPTIIGLLCAACHVRDLGRIDSILQAGGCVCETCGLHIVHTSDIIVRQCPLKAGPR